MSDSEFALITLLKIWGVNQNALYTFILISSYGYHSWENEKISGIWQLPVIRKPG
jgi:hypothetical protein